MAKILLILLILPLATFGLPTATKDQISVVDVPADLENPVVEKTEDDNEEKNSGPIIVTLTRNPLFSLFSSRRDSNSEDKKDEATETEPIDVISQLLHRVQSQFSTMFSDPGPLFSVSHRPSLFFPFRNRRPTENEEKTDNVEIIETQSRPQFVSRPSLFDSHPFFGSPSSSFFPSLFGLGRKPSNETTEDEEIEPPKNFSKTTTETKIINGQEVQVNKTTHQFSNGNGNFQSFFQVVHVVPKQPIGPLKEIEDITEKPKPEEKVEVVEFEKEKEELAPNPEENEIKELDFEQFIIPPKSEVRKSEKLYRDLSEDIKVNNQNDVKNAKLIAPDEDAEVFLV